MSKPSKTGKLAWCGKRGSACSRRQPTSRTTCPRVSCMTWRSCGSSMTQRQSSPVRALLPVVPALALACSRFTLLGQCMACRTQAQEACTQTSCTMQTTFLGRCPFCKTPTLHPHIITATYESCLHVICPMFSDNLVSSTYDRNQMLDLGSCA